MNAPERRAVFPVAKRECPLTLSAMGSVSDGSRLLVAIVCVLRFTYLAEGAQIADGELQACSCRVDVVEERGEKLGELALRAESDLIAVAVDVCQGNGVRGNVEEGLDAGGEVIPRGAHE